MSQRKHLIHIRSNQTAQGSDAPKVPLAEDLEYGEIAINYLKDKERMFIKNSQNEIIHFYSSKVIDENEEIIAQALSDLDERLQSIEVQKYDFENMNETTHSELVALRNGSNLVPGMYYRITDYVTTTSQDDTRSANHQFDVIVLALGEATLSENAHAIQHNGDEYFSNSNLNSWEIKYCLDNDTTRFMWANTTNGKGVIYFMKDEWNNECPYDFKNIQFLRKVKQTTTGYYEINTSSGDDTWVFTFSANEHDLQNNTWSGLLDGSLEPPYMHMNDEAASSYHDNVIKPYISVHNSEDDITITGLQFLNDNVFIGYYEVNGDIDNFDYQKAWCAHNNIFNGNCRHNTFEHNCYNNVFGEDCESNNFGNNFRANTLGAGFNKNTFGDDCLDNTFDSDCSFNTFGNGAKNNVFGSHCWYNTFTNNAMSNAFGCNCWYNTFGSELKYNNFRNNCGGNSFGNYVTNCSIGNNCYNNIIGNYCESNILENAVQNVSISKNYSYYITIESNNQYVTLTSSQNTNATNLLKNITIAKGTNSTTTMKTISHETLNDTFKTTYQPANSQVVNV